METQTLESPRMAPRVVETFMEKHANIVAVSDMASVPNLDGWLKQAAAELKVPIMQGLAQKTA